MRLRLLSAEYPVGVSVATSVSSGRLVSVTIRNGGVTIASASQASISTRPTRRVLAARGLPGNLAGMLAKSRLVSVLLFGLGVALVVAGLIAPRFIHLDARMSLDSGSSTWTLTDESAQSRLVGDPEGRVVDAPVSRQLHMDIQNPSDNEKASLRVGETLMRDSQQGDLDRLISAEVWTLSVDRLTGAVEGPAVLSDQLASPVSEVTIDGYWLKFPSQAKETTYEVFDPTLRATRPAAFVEELEMDGRTVYRYRQDIEREMVAQSFASPLNTTTFDGEGEDPRGYLFHSVTRDFFVDMVSGLVVEIREDVDDYYGTVDGEKREQVLLFDGRMSQAQIDSHLAEASKVPDRGFAAAIRWGVVGVGALLALAGLLGSFRSPARVERRALLESPLNSSHDPDDTRKN
ncbi:putative DUF3068 family protein [Corynebacterium testudinoris]|uniref:Putative DUF3068 family protein n=2 Tax=Corynebacterium testudinoris TaxID=136857 RepID=A0A0G3H529_9CORY|nr:putative DUF3068 family protein [Corynebacterium testudinoris]